MTSPRSITRLAAVWLTLTLWPTLAGAALEMPDMPMFLTATGVPPNVVMTFDDSGSMRRGWAPENVTSSQAVIDGARFKSPSVNGLYYNPRNTYSIPVRSDGTTYSTSFSSAKFNGFVSGSDTINLGSAYRVVGQSEPQHDYSNDCPCYNTSSCSTYLTTANSAGTCRLVKHPGSNTVTTYTATCTDVVFNDRGFRRGRPRNDEIDIQGSGTGTITINGVNSGTVNCSSFFTGITAGTNVTVSGSGGYNGTYTVESSVDNNTIRITNAFSSDSPDNPGPTKTLSWSRTTSSAGDTAGVPAYYYLYYLDFAPDKANPATPAGCDGSRANDSCYVRVVVGSGSGFDRDGNGTISPAEADERQNFANWYSFYRTRAMAVMAGAMTAVDGVLDGSIRMGWQTINQCTSFGTSCQGYDGANRENRLRTLSASYKTNFYNWIQRFEVSGNTPLRGAFKKAGDYFMTTGTNSPYAEDPYVSLGTVHSCRKNFHVLFTDGYWNSESTFSTPGSNANIDSTSTTTLGDGVTVYTPRAPYKDVNVPVGTSYSNSNGIADTAFYYWAKDLNTGLENNVASTVTDPSGTVSQRYWNPKNDPATWQHMVNYTIGLGLSAGLRADCYYQTDALTPDPNNPDPGCPAWGGDMYSGDYQALVEGELNWPRINTNPTLNAEPDGHVYELWHAAINSRGKFYSADDPAELVAAFQDVMDTISSQAAAGGGAGLSSNTTTTTQEGATIYEAKFNDDWSGLLSAIPAANINLDDKDPNWEASVMIPSAPNRRIFTLNGTAQLFDSCSGDLATALNKNPQSTASSPLPNDNLCAQRLAWLRGYGVITSASWSANTITFNVPNHGFASGNSVTILNAQPDTYNGVYTITKINDGTFTAPLPFDPGAYTSNSGRARYSAFRERGTSVLGDIINSAPAYVHDEDMGYGASTIAVAGGGTSGSYASYLTTKASRLPAIFVGANDGMLHAFYAPDCDEDASTAPPSCTSLSAGTELFAYVPAGVYHNLGKLTEAAYQHKYFVDGSPTVGDVYLSGWKTYLVGGLRLGGKTIYALDISETSACMPPASPSCAPSSFVKWEFTDSDLWQTYSQPQIGAINTSQWAAIFGNGYKTSDDTSSNPDSAHLFVVDLLTGNQIAKIAAGTATGNGLSTPYLHDENNDGIVDVVYAGDLKGNLWKFVNSSGTFTLGNGGDPLFTTNTKDDGSGVRQPITTQPKVAPHPNGGVLVYFGTGKYLEVSATDPDHNDLTNGDVQTFYAIWDKPSTTGTVARSTLQSHRIVDTLSHAGYTVRTTSNATLDWTSHRGWRMDMPTPSAGSPSERIVSPALVLSFDDVLVPDRILFVSNVLYDDPCSSGGTTWLMELDLVTGNRTETSVFDFNNDMKFDALDRVGSVDDNNDGDTTDSGEDNGTASGIALPPRYGLTGAPLILDQGDGTIIKAFTGSTGVSGTPTATQMGENRHSSGGPTPPTRVYWQQIL